MNFTCRQGAVRSGLAPRLLQQFEPSLAIGQVWRTRRSAPRSDRQRWPSCAGSRARLCRPPAARRVHRRGKPERGPLGGHGSPTPARPDKGVSHCGPMKPPPRSYIRPPPRPPSAFPAVPVVLVVLPAADAASANCSASLLLCPCLRTMLLVAWGNCTSERAEGPPARNSASRSWSGSDCRTDRRLVPPARQHHARPIRRQQRRSREHPFVSVSKKVTSRYKSRACRSWLKVNERRTGA